MNTVQLAQQALDNVVRNEILKEPHKVGHLRLGYLAFQSIRWIPTTSRAKVGDVVEDVAISRAKSVRINPHQPLHECLEQAFRTLFNGIESDCGGASILCYDPNWIPKHSILVTALTEVEGSTSITNADTGISFDIIESDGILSVNIAWGVA
jgi:hypothetical protein